MIALFVAMQGMVDAGEQVSTTLKREFMEEAMSNTSTDQKNKVAKKISTLFSQGQEVINRPALLVTLRYLCSVMHVQLG